MNEKLSDEAQREAARRYPEISAPGLTYQSMTLRYHRRGAFVEGAEWQAAHDREHIKALEAEAEQLRARYYDALIRSGKYPEVRSVELGH